MVEHLVALGGKKMWSVGVTTLLAMRRMVGTIARVVAVGNCCCRRRNFEFKGT